MQPYNLQTLLVTLRRHSSDVVLYLPRTSDMRQIAKAMIETNKITVMHYCMEGASKMSIRRALLGYNCLTELQALCAFFGSFKFSVDSTIT